MSADTVDAECKKCGKLYEVDKARWWRTTPRGNADTAKCPKCGETLTPIADKMDELARGAADAD